MAILESEARLILGTDHGEQIKKRSTHSPLFYLAFSVFTPYLPSSSTFLFIFHSFLTISLPFPPPSLSHLFPQLSFICSFFELIALVYFQWDPFWIKSYNLLLWFLLLVAKSHLGLCYFGGWLLLFEVSSRSLWKKRSFPATTVALVLWVTSTRLHPIGNLLQVWMLN